jgi:hypothetical protein
MTSDLREAEGFGWLLAIVELLLVVVMLALMLKDTSQIGGFLIVFLFIHILLLSTVSYDAGGEREPEMQSKFFFKRLTRKCFVNS